MKQLHYIHALVVDTDEFVPNNTDWDYYAEVDYAVHALYIQENEDLIFLDDNCHSSVVSEIKTFLNGIRYAGIEVYGEEMIAVVPVGHSYNGTTVKQVLKEQENLYEAVI